MADGSPIPVTRMSGNLSADHESLEKAYRPYVNRYYPGCKNLGDVVIAMSEGREPDYSYEESLKQAALEKQALEDAALELEMQDFEPLRDSVRIQKPARQAIYKGHRPAHVDVITKGDRL